MVKRIKTGKIVFFFFNLDVHNSKLNKKGLLFSGKMLVCGWNLSYLEVNGIKNDHSADVTIFPKS